MSVSAEVVVKSPLATTSASLPLSTRSGDPMPTLAPMIPIEEEDAVKRILAHHGANTPELAKALITLLEWVHQKEQSKLNRYGKPMPMISLLGSVGVYGAEVLGPTPNGGSGHG